MNPTVDIWDAVVRAHAAPVYRLAYRLTGNRPDAEELTQDVFVRVFGCPSGHRVGAGSSERWLHRITTNLFLEQVGRRRLVASPAGVHAAQVVDGDVQSALDSLPAEFRVAVVLRDVEGLPYEEIAAALGVTVATVAKRIRRGREQLRSALADGAPRRGWSAVDRRVECRPA